MHNLHIEQSLYKQIKKGISFALVGTMLATAGSFIKPKENSRDNGRYHSLMQLQDVSLDVYDGVNVYVNNTSYAPVNVHGEGVMVFSYQGTTYLPVRAISELFHVDISWDAVTSRVYIGAQPQKVPVLDQELVDAIYTIKTYLPLYDNYADRLDTRSDQLHRAIMDVSIRRYDIIESYGNQEMPLEVKEQIGRISDIINEVSGWSIKLNNLNYSSRLRTSFIIIDKVEQGKYYTGEEKDHLLQLAMICERDYATLEEVLNNLNDTWLETLVLEAEQCLNNIANYQSKMLVLK